MNTNSLLGMLPENLQDWVIRLLFSGERKISFFQRLIDGEASGQQVTETLRMLSRLYEKNDCFEFFIVKKALEKRFLGKKDVEIFSEWLSSTEIIILNTADQTGLGAALERCITLEQRGEEIRHVIVSKMWQPVLQVLLVIAMIYVVSVTILPQLFDSTTEYDPSKSNFFTVGIFHIMNFVNSMWGIVFLAIIVTGFVAMFKTFSTWTGPWRNRFDMFPPWSSYRIIVGASWLSSVTIMISAGISVRQIFKETYDIAEENNPWLAERIEAIASKYGAQSFGKAFVQSGYKFPDKELVDEMEIYAEQGVEDERYVQLADKWSAKGADSVKKQVQIISSFTMMLFYVLAIFFALGIILMVQDITGSISL